VCSLAFGLPLGLAGVGCGGDEKPAPQKLDRVNPFDRVKPSKRSGPDDPLRNPAYETPRGRDGEQLPEAEIDAVLAEAAGHAKSGNVAQQRVTLRKCANKTPVSARCDGEMGLSMIDNKNRRATALYYLVSAAGADDPKADADFYVRVGEGLRRYGKLPEAIAALELAVARDPSAQNLFLLGQALSLQPERLVEAADRIAEARAKDDRLEWLHDEAVIRGQIPVAEQAEAALALFHEYIGRAQGMSADEVPTVPERLEGRIEELELLAKQYPTQAEWEAHQAEVAAKKAGEEAEGASEDGEPEQAEKAEKAEKAEPS
jgi:tetratricopeptide (TPR) repeat protein